MAVTYNTQIVRDGLAIFFDPANPKSYIQNKNQLLSSSNLTSIWNTNLGFIRTANAGIAPDGSQTANKFDTSLGNAGVFQYINVFANKTYTYSLYAKHISGETSIVFGKDVNGQVIIRCNLSNGTVTTSAGTPNNIQSTYVGDGWYRFSFSTTIAADGTETMIIYAAFSRPSSFLIWGPQVEISSSVTNYSPTGSTNVSFVDLANQRSATLSSSFKNINNILPYNGTSSNISFPISGIDFSKEQTIMMGLMPNENDGSRRNPYSHEYGGYGTITHEPAGELNYYHGPNGGDSSGYNNITSSFTIAQNEKSIIAVSRGPQNTKWYKNGVLSDQYVNNVVTAGTLATTAQIGSGYAGYYSGNIYFFMLYNRQLSDAEVLQNYNALRGRCGI